MRVRGLDRVDQRPLAAHTESVAERSDAASRAALAGRVGSDRTRRPSPIAATYRGCSLPFPRSGSRPNLSSIRTTQSTRPRAALGLDGVLVWVNPIEQGLDRSKLDPLLREVAEAGVWVSAHPDVIPRMATKQVLVDTRGDELERRDAPLPHARQLRELPTASRGPLVLKQQRGMVATGVWKVEPGRAYQLVRVQHAAKRQPSEVMPLGSFVARCEPYFANGGLDGRAAVPATPRRGDDPRLPQPRPSGRVRASVPAWTARSRGSVATAHGEGLQPAPRRPSTKPSVT